MFVSAARKKLNIAIQAATDPADIVQLTMALSRLFDAEGRAKGRRQRQKARANDAKKKQLPVLDLEGEFIPNEQGGGLIVDAKRECDPTDSV
jgi:hypothetical protein